MKLESVVYAISGVFFGLIVGWIVGSQQTSLSTRARVAQAESAPEQAAPAGASEPNTPPPAILDETKVQALQSVAEHDP